MAWNDLSISQKSHLMNIFRGQGVYSLSEMKQIYDSMYPSAGQDEWGGNVAPVYAGGGYTNNGDAESIGTKVKTPLIEKVKNKVKDWAYRIGAENHHGIGAKPGAIIKSLWKTRKGDVKEYNELKAYLYGPEKVEFKPVGSKNTTGPTFDREYPEYERKIVARDTLFMPEDYREILGEVAKQHKNIYLNADVQHEDEPRHDAGNYPLKLRINDKGEIIGDAADLYDFDREYVKKHKTNNILTDALIGIEAGMLRKIGKPYVVRHNGIPVKFVPKDSEYYGIAEQNLRALNAGEDGSPTSHYGAEDNILKRIGREPIKASFIDALEYEGNAFDPEHYAEGGKIHIKKSKRGTFTAAAKKHGMGVQAFARKVLAHPENYSPAMRKKANFARNASRWKAEGGDLGLTPALDEALSLL